MTKDFDLDTSADYDHMLDYVSEDNLTKGSLSGFLDEEPSEYKPEVRKKEVDKEFPEDWQKLYVNFRNIEDYAKFMRMIDSAPVPKLIKLTYEKPENRTNIFNFVDEDE